MNEFVAKNGIISKGNVFVTSSVTATSFTGSLSGTSSYSITSSYVSFVGKTNNYIPKWSSNQLTATSLIYDNGTYVGIGTDSPQYALDITSNTGATPLLMIRNVSTAPTYLGILLNVDSGSNVANRNWFIGCNTNTYGDFTIRTGNALSSSAITGTDRLYIGSSGNVGIGTNTPLYPLDVSGNARVNGLIYWANTSSFLSNDQGGAIELGSSLGSGTQPYIDMHFGVGSAQDYNVRLSNPANNVFGIYTNNGGGVFFVSSSNVGIGTANPCPGAGTVLDIYNSTDSQIRLHTGVTGTTSADGMLLSVASNGDGYLWNYENKAIVFGQNNAETFRITGSYVGIGTTSPSSILTVYQGAAGSYTTSSVRYIDFVGPFDGTVPASTSNAGARTAIRLGNTTDGKNALICSVSEDNLGYSRMTGLSFWTSPTDTAPIERLRITSTGIVGIGLISPNPAYRVHISGSTQPLTITTSGSLGPLITWEISGAPKSYMGMDGGSLTTGASQQDLTIRNDGTSQVIRFNISSGTKMVISGSNVGIGTANPTSILHVKPSAISSDLFILERYASTAKLIYGYEMAADGYLEVRSGADVPIVKLSGYASTQSYFMNNVGINTRTPSTTLDVNGYISASRFYPYASNNTYIQGDTSGMQVAGSGYLYVNATSGLYVQTTSTLRGQIINDSVAYLTINGGTSGITYFGGGSVGIGITNPFNKLDVIGNISCSAITCSNVFATNISSSAITFTGKTNNYAPIWQSNVLSATSSIFDTGTNVGIGTNNPTYKLQVNGSFGATTKSFIIDHPTIPNKKLVYGSLESPYHGVRLTGKDKLIKGICKVVLPDYINKLVRENGINIQVTPIKYNKQLYVDEINIENNYFVVKYNKRWYNKFIDVEFFWTFTGTRLDVPELETVV